MRSSRRQQFKVQLNEFAQNSCNSLILFSFVDCTQYFPHFFLDQKCLPALMNPLANAWAILPPPMKPILFIFPVSARSTKTFVLEKNLETQQLTLNALQAIESSVRHKLTGYYGQIEFIETTIQRKII